MKKITALLLVLVLVAGQAVSFAETAQEETPAVFDDGYFTENGEVFEVKVSDDGESALITTRDTIENRSFVTPYDSDTYYSVIFPDIFILDYPRKEERAAALRIRIVYNGTKAMNFSSVTFIGAEREYTFTGVIPDGESASAEDGTVTEDLVIIGGKSENNARFLSEMMADSYEYAVRRYSQDGGEETELPVWTVILHGDEDVTIALPAGFWTDFAMFTLALTDMNALPLIMSSSGTDCEVTQMK